jgi:hypothetical protein
MMCASLWLAAAPADEFDFGVDMEPVGAEADPVSPLSGWLRLLGSRQVDGTERWIDLGAGAGLRLDLSTSAGQLYGDFNLRFNVAYRLEKDSDDLRRRYEVEPWLRELFWRRAFGPLTLTLGDVMTPWGVVDLLPIIDRLSVTDHGRAFFEDPEDIYSGQLTLKADLYFDAHRLSIAVVPYPLFDRVRDADHPYSLTSGQRLEPAERDWSPELAARYHLSADWGSVALAGGYVHNREPILRAELNQLGEVSLHGEHQHYGYVGCTASLPIAPFLFKLELTYDHKRPAQSAARFLMEPLGRVSRASAVVGVDVNLGYWGTLVAEAQGQYPIEPGERLALRRPSARIAVAWNASFRNDNLDLSTTLIWLESLANVVARLEVAYDATNELRLAAKLIGFFINDRLTRYGRLGAYDRIDLSAEYSF